MQWTPLGEGASWATRRLVQVRDDRWELRPSFGTWLGWCSYLALAPIMTTVALLEPRAETLLGAALVGCLSVAFLFLTPDFGVRVVFDGRSRRLFRTRSLTGERGVRSADFDAVVALQLLPLEATHEAPTTAYELNAVLRDDARLHLVNHTDLLALRADAATLATVLGVPVWDRALDHLRAAV